MNGAPLKTVLIGFGKIAACYASDSVMARYLQYATHAQVLRDHPLFSWDAVVDPAPDALERAKSDWGIDVAVSCLEELPGEYEPDVAVITTPPQYRFQIVEKLPGLKAVLVEKPLGTNICEAERFHDICRQANILAQVNLWRRGDELCRSLKSGGLHSMIGQAQAVFGIYGNGLLNSGTHMVDFARMLFGEIDSVQALGSLTHLRDAPIAGDVDVPFALRMKRGQLVVMQPIRFEHYRENSLDIWGETARLAIVQEGLENQLFPRCENRAVSGEREIACDRPEYIPNTVGKALYNMYSNLADAVHFGATLWSPIESALVTTRAVEGIIHSAKSDGKPFAVEDTFRLSPTGL